MLFVGILSKQGFIYVHNMGTFSCPCNLQTLLILDNLFGLLILLHYQHHLTFM